MKPPSYPPPPAWWAQPYSSSARALTALRPGSVIRLSPDGVIIPDHERIGAAAKLLPLDDIPRKTLLDLDRR